MSTNRLITVVVAVALASLLSCQAASAAPGDLDETFGGDGVVRIDAVPNPLAEATGPDGSVVVVGLSARDEEVAARLTRDGSLDPAFGTGGLAPFAIDTYGPGVTDLVVDPRGRTVMVGGDSSGALALRLTANGQPDPTFGLNGRVDGLGSLDFARAVGLTPSGQVLVLAEGPDDAFDGDASLGVARLLEDGSLDPAFGSDGVALAPVGNQGFGLGGADLAVTPDGSIVFGSNRLAQLTPSGQLDPAFGEGGIAPGQFSSASRIFRIVIGSYRIVIGVASCQVTGPGAGCRPVAAIYDRSGTVLDVRESSVGIGFAGQAERLYGAGNSSATAELPATMGIRQLTRRLKLKLGFGVKGFAPVYDHLRSVAALEVEVSAQGELLLLGMSEDHTPVVARVTSSPGEGDADADGFTDEADRCFIGYANHHHGCRAVERTLKISERQDQVVVRVGSELPVCEQGTHVKLFAGAARRLVGSKTVAESSAVSFKAPGGASYYASARANYTDMARCRSAEA